jgi:endonuclease/exonuclease/phosphatase family metal-dependent hydrolase
MSHLRRLIPALLLLAGLAAPGAAQEPRPLRVVAWNLEWFPGGSPFAKAEEKRSAVARASAHLARLEPDILILQEVTSERSLRQALQGHKNLQLHVISNFTNTNPDADTDLVQQVAIASTLPAVSAWTGRWKAGFADPPRGYAFAALRVSTGEVVMVYSLHLKSNRASTPFEAQLNIAKREDAARQLRQHIRETAPTFAPLKVRGVILGGDFNTNLDNPEWISEGTLRELIDEGYHNTWSGVPADRRETWRGNNFFAASTLDFILLRDLDWPAAQVDLLATDISDHRPVIVDLRALAR